MEGEKAIVLLSGGLDSTTCLSIALREGFDCSGLFVEYGQRHAVEKDAARRVCEALLRKKPVELSVNLGALGGSALTADQLPVPKGRSATEMASDVPATYVPARNTVLLSLALATAEVHGAWHIFIGVNSVDYSGYPDCQPEFVSAFENLCRLGTKAGAEGQTFSIHTPLAGLSKADIIRRGVELGVDYSLTHSCYDPVGDLACGQCDSCQIRKRGFEEAGIKDVTRYVSN